MTPPASPLVVVVTVMLIILVSWVHSLYTASRLLKRQQLDLHRAWAPHSLETSASPLTLCDLKEKRKKRKELCSSIFD